MKNIFSLLCNYVIPLFTVIIISTSCKKTNDTGNARQEGPDVNFFAITADDKLLFFNGKNTSVAQRSLTITGMQSAEHLLGIDFRPNTGQLFAVGSTSRLYTINITTGVATAVGTNSFSPTITGTVVGFNFNPTVDRIRLVTATGQNLRLNPETGAVAAIDGAINGAAGASVTAVAYTQNRAGATSTVLFDIDVVNNKLYRQDPPNAGTLIEVGSLGVDAEAAKGFDISPDSAYAIAALTVAGQAALYTIDLKSGNASMTGDFKDQIVGLAIPTQPVAYAVSAGNNLMILDPSTGTSSFSKPITGLQSSEDILGIDMRPATGQLFALGSSSRLYTLNITTGAATQVGTTSFSTALNGTSFGFDFNPTVDRIRVISNTGQNLRLNPIDGTVAAVDAAINPAASVITAAAYTNNFAGATTTVLYDIDTQTDRLVKQDPPNAGTIVDIGPLGVNVDHANGFDIGGSSGIAYGIFTVSGATRIYSVNLTNGTATGGAAFAQEVKGFCVGLGL